MGFFRDSCSSSGFGGSGKTRLVRSLVRRIEENGLEGVVVINDTKLMLDVQLQQLTAECGRSKGQRMSKLLDDGGCFCCGVDAKVEAVGAGGPVDGRRFPAKAGRFRLEIAGIFRKLPSRAMHRPSMNSPPCTCWAWAEWGVNQLRSWNGPAKRRRRVMRVRYFTWASAMRKAEAYQAMRPRRANFL